MTFRANYQFFLSPLLSSKSEQYYLWIKPTTVINFTNLWPIKLITNLLKHLLMLFIIIESGESRRKINHKINLQNQNCEALEKTRSNFSTTWIKRSLYDCGLNTLLYYRITFHLIKITLKTTFKNFFTLLLVPTRLQTLDHVKIILLWEEKWRSKIMQSSVFS